MEIFANEQLIAAIEASFLTIENKIAVETSLIKLAKKYEVLFFKFGRYSYI